VSRELLTLAPAPHASESGRAVREALWQRRIQHEHEHNLYEGEELAFKAYSMATFSWLATHALKLAGLYERGRRNAESPQLVELTWTPPRLPAALDGLRILHLSDFHFSRLMRGFTEGAAACVNGVEADLVLITGDYRYGHFGPVEHVPHHLREVLHGVRVQHGIYAVLGNHDISHTVHDLQDIGINVLVNEGRLIELRGTPIWLGGTDDQHAFRCASLEATLDGRPHDLFTILLTHTPEMAPHAVASACDIVLCGHTHGGQLCLPGGIPLKLNGHCPLRFTRGPWRSGQTYGLTTHGLGTTDMPLRYNCPAQAHLITLRA